MNVSLRLVQRAFYAVCCAISKDGESVRSAVPDGDLGSGIEAVQEYGLNNNDSKAVQTCTELYMGGAFLRLSCHGSV